LYFAVWFGNWYLQSAGYGLANQPHSFLSFPLTKADVTKFSVTGNVYAVIKHGLNCTE
jgi:hypothetical protein